MGKNNNFISVKDYLEDCIKFYSDSMANQIERIEKPCSPEYRKMLSDMAKVNEGRVIAYKEMLELFIG